MTGRLAGGLTFLAAAIALGAPGVSGAADVDKQKVKSKVTLQKVDFQAGVASGFVKSAEKICQKKRTVSLIEVSDYGDEKVKTAVTGNDGSFELKSPIIEIWQYKVVAKRKTIAKGNTKLVCKGAVSKQAIPSRAAAAAEPGADAAVVIKKKKVFETTVTLDDVKPNSGQAKGQVSSAKAFCLSDRNLTLQASGSFYGEVIRGLGTSKTDGSYSLKSTDKLPPSGESYTVTVGKKKGRTVRVRPNGDKVIRKKICLPATSNVFTPVPDPPK